MGYFLGLLNENVLCNFFGVMSAKVGLYTLELKVINFIVVKTWIFFSTSKHRNGCDEI